MKLTPFVKVSLQRAWLLLGLWLAQSATALPFVAVPDSVAPAIAQLGSPRALAQDRAGFIWIAGDAGLGRYNGRELLPFTEVPAPRALLGDSGGGVWAAGPEGVFLFADGRRFKRLDSTPAQVLVEGAGGVYVGGPGGLWGFALNGAPLAAAERVLGVRAVLHDSKERLWVAADSGLHVFDAKLHPLAHYADGFARAGGRVVALAEDQLGRLWLATEAGGLLRSREGEREFAPFRAGLGAVVSMLRDASGRLWLATRDGGLLEFDPLSERWTTHTSDPFDASALATNQVRALLRDQVEHLWVATAAGLQRANLAPQPVQTLAHLAGTRALIGVGDGRLWVGGKQGLLELEAERHRVARGLTSAELGGPVTALAVRDQQLLYAAVWERGVVAVDRLSLGVVALPTGAERTLSLSYSPRAGLVALQEDGTLLGLGEGGWQPLGHGVQAAAADPAGGIWLIAGETLLRRAPGQPGAVPVSLPPDFARPRALYVAGDAEVWVGGEYGRALRLDASGRVLAEQTFALAGGTLTQLFEDGLGRLWGASAEALAGPGGGGVTLRLGPGSSFSLASFTGAAVFRDRRGFVYLGGLAGVDVLHPQHLNPEPPPAPIVLDATRRGAGPWLPARERLRLSDRDGLALGFAALDYGAAPALTYQLLGYDPEPITAAGGRRVHYGQLSAGHYEFVVNRAGESLAAVRFPVEVRASAWNRLWSFAGVLAPAAVGLWLLLGRRRRAQPPPPAPAAVEPVDPLAQLRPAVLALAELADRAGADASAVPAFRAQLEHVRQLLGVAPAAREPTILVVDDDPVNRMVLSSMLSLAGYSVREAGDGPAGLGCVAEDSSIALVILDVMMPQLSGYETCQRLRAQPRGRYLPVIFLTAQQGDSDRERCRAVGGDCILYKPVDKAALLREVARLLAAAGVAASRPQLRQVVPG